MNFQNTAVILFFSVLICACVSSGPLRNNAGAFYEFSDDQPTRIEVDINRILFNQICVRGVVIEGKKYIPSECYRLQGGLNPLRSQSGDASSAASLATNDVEDTAPEVEQEIVDATVSVGSGQALASETLVDTDEAASSVHFPRRNTDGKAVFSDLVTALDQLPENRRKQVRNAAAYQMIAASEHGCRSYLFTLRGVQTNSRFATDTLSGAAATAASLTDATDPSKLYSALASFGIMTGASIDRSYFANQAVETVREAIDDQRSRLRTQLEADLRKSYADYPFGIAMADLIKFHSSCSMMEGLSQVSKAVEGREAAVFGARLVAQRLQLSGATSDQIVQALTGLEEAHFGLKTESADQPVAINAESLRSDLVKEAAKIVNALDSQDVKDVASFNASNAKLTALCPASNTDLICLLAEPLDAAWWLSTGNALPDPVAKGAEAYNAAFLAALNEALGTKITEIAAQRAVMIALLEQLTASKSLQRQDITGLGGARLLAASPPNDPVIALAHQAFNMSGAKPANASAQPDAEMALTFIRAYLSAATAS